MTTRVQHGDDHWWTHNTVIETCCNLRGLDARHWSWTVFRWLGSADGRHCTRRTSLYWPTKRMRSETSHYTIWNEDRIQCDEADGTQYSTIIHYLQQGTTWHSVQYNHSLAKTGYNMTFSRLQYNHTLATTGYNMTFSTIQSFIFVIITSSPHMQICFCHSHVILWGNRYRCPTMQSYTSYNSV